MSLYANAADASKIRQGINSILLEAEARGKNLALVNVKQFYSSLKLNLPFSKFESELSDTVRSPEICATHPNWTLAHWDQVHSLFIHVDKRMSPVDVDSVAVFNF